MPENKINHASLLNFITQVKHSAALIYEFESKPYHYGDIIVYPAEIQTMHQIGRVPGITVTTLARQSNKTKSAYSQILKRLSEKELVKSIQNENNRREYSLHLTESGQAIFEDYQTYLAERTERYCDVLNGFSTEQLDSATEIYHLLNQEFHDNIKSNQSTPVIK